MKVTESFMPFGFTARMGAGVVGASEMVAVAAATCSVSDAVLPPKFLSLL